ncbi:BON domain-containing protein [Lysobacter sp. K5869]|uniref:BON domain-containing protein n=1 Tax=Lysobacter sp. K5869 TaxID=2820808 RepID=UPI001C05EE8E|nr:BON domain-containing protein [Lysobacter sp. K5869]QWP75400.1 BON domain-containing protein [Lysobacter sp. K5869]
MNAAMKTLLAALAAAAAGAAAMYWNDPKLGRQRRALARDRGGAAVRKLGHGARAHFDGRAKRFADRAKGLLARTRAQPRDGDFADDEMLRDRVRSRLGHLLRFQDAIRTDVERGRVVLHGHASPRTLARIVRAAGSLPGVAGVDARDVVRATPPAPRLFRRMSEALRSD